jgi:hypothetical protein
MNEVIFVYFCRLRCSRISLTIFYSIDDKSERLSKVQQQKGHLPDLEKLLVTMKKGDTRTLVFLLIDCKKDKSTKRMEGLDFHFALRRWQKPVVALPCHVSSGS